MGVFVSSHILAEIQELCDTVAFIENGEITEIETLENIRNSFFYYLETNVNKNTTKLLEEIKGVVSIKENTNVYVLELVDIKPSDILKTLIYKDIEVHSFTRHIRGLEERYLEVIKGGIR